METLNRVIRALKMVLLVALIIIVSFLVASYFFAMALGLELFFFTPDGAAFSKLYYLTKARIYLFTAITIDIPTYINVGLIFAFLWGVFLFCFVAAWTFRESFHKVVKNSFSRPVSHTLKNFLFAMPIITSMLLTAVIAIHSFQEAHGLPTGQLPPQSPFERFFGVTYAVVIEEIGFRITPIGAFLIVYLFSVAMEKAITEPWGQRLKIFFLAWLYPEKAKKMLGLKTVDDSGIRGGISSSEWIIIILTSAVFGLVHYLSGSGWEAGKITLVFVQGFAMGLTYLIYGVQAPILIHWFFNYYGHVYYELALGFYPNTSLLVSIIDKATIILGIIGWTAVAVLGILWMIRVIAKKCSSVTLPQNFP